MGMGMGIGTLSPLLIITFHLQAVPSLSSQFSSCALR